MKKNNERYLQEQKEKYHQIETNAEQGLPWITATTPKNEMLHWDDN